MSETRQVARVIGIWISAEARGEPTEIPEARLEAGRGIVGDRYHVGGGTFSPPRMDPDHQLTLISAEEIDGLSAATGRPVPYGVLRRNVVTRGVDLNALVGKRFRIGSVELFGVRLCEPCAHLASMAGDGVLKHLVHRGGLRAEIVTGGIVRPGDPIETP